MKPNTSRRRKQQGAGSLQLQRIVLSGTILCLMAGIASSPDRFETSSPEAVAGIVTHVDTWTLQLLVGFVVAMIAIAWGIRSLQPALVGRTRNRRSMIDVALIGFVCLLLLGQTLNGLTAALGYGGGIDTTHLASAVLLIAVPVVFVLAEYAHGQIALILRVLSPGPLAYEPRPPRLTELMQRYVTGTKDSRRARNVAPTTVPARRTALVAVAITTLLLLTVIAFSGARTEVQTAGVHHPAQR